MTQLIQVATAERPVPNLDRLPDEVIQQILQHLDGLSLPSISRVCKRLRAISYEPLLWKTLVLNDFTFWDSKYQIAQKRDDLTFHDWKDLYAVRHTANVATRRGIGLLVENPVGRLATAGRILDHGYGIKDELLRLQHKAADSDCVLAQRYWSQMVLACLNRALALEEWQKIKFRTDYPNATEVALAGLDMFVLGPQAAGDIDDTLRRLDDAVEAIRRAYPDIDQQTPRTKAVTIAHFLREKKWIGIDENRDYYSIEHQFLGLCLRSSHRNSLPLITCVIYSYVCRKFGLRAQPCSFPMHVHAVVQPPVPVDCGPQLNLDNEMIDITKLPADYSPNENVPNDQTHLYMDPFNTHEPISLTSLTQQLNFIAPQAPPAQRTAYLLPASARDLVIRSAHNIMRSVQSTSFDRRPTPFNSLDPEIDPYSAAYGALFALIMFPSSPQGLGVSLPDLRQHYAHHFIEDLRNYENHILPLTIGLGGFGGDAGMRDPLVNLVRQEDATVKIPKRRSGPNQSVDLDSNALDVKYTVGTVFRHRRQGYTAVIYGWDSKCEMEERWIIGNGVDRLPRGRGQPFYNAFVDDRSTRYVAQENVIELGPGEVTAAEVEELFSVEIGKWFLRFDEKTARFVSNVKDEYPDD